MIRRSTKLLWGLLSFVKATVIGGIFVLAPLVVFVTIIAQAVNLAFHLIHPWMVYLPFESVTGASLALFAGICVIIAICFVAGLLANTALATWLVKHIETLILSNLPGYTLIKSMGEGLVGKTHEGSRRAVLVHFEHTSQIGFQMDVLQDGRMVVFVPGVPSPWSGQLHIVQPDRCETLEISVREALECLQRMGLNSRAALDRPLSSR